MLRTTGAQPSLCAQVLFTADTAGTETGVINNSNDDSGPVKCPSEGHAQHQETETITAQWDSSHHRFMSDTCAFPTVTH